MLDVELMVVFLIGLKVLTWMWDEQWAIAFDWGVEVW
jgi:hypothetical protein